MSAWIPVSALWLAFAVASVGYFLRVRHPHRATRLRTAARLAAVAALVLVLVWGLLRAGTDVAL